MVVAVVVRETSGEDTIVGEELEGTTIGTAAVEADSHRAAVAVASSTLTAKIDVDSRCLMRAELEDGSVEQEAVPRGEIITTADWPSAPRTIRTRGERRHRAMEERRDMADVQATIKETEPEVSIHRTTTNRFPRWEVNRLE